MRATLELDSNEATTHSPFRLTRIRRNFIKAPPKKDLKLLKRDIIKNSVLLTAPFRAANRAVGKLGGI